MTDCLSCPEWTDEDGEETHHWCGLEAGHALPHRCHCGAAWDDEFRDLSEWS